MANKNKKHSTADLIVGHAKRHLAQRESDFSQSADDQSGTIFFAFAGVIVMLAAFFVINSATGRSQIMSSGATDYVAQQNFYNGTELHAAANFADAREKVHAAAQAAELSQFINFIGLVLVLAGIWYLHREHNIFGSGRVKFRIRRIR